MVSEFKTNPSRCRGLMEALVMRMRRLSIAWCAFRLAPTCVTHASTAVTTDQHKSSRLQGSEVAVVKLEALNSHAEHFQVLTNN